MITPYTPPNESARLRALLNYEILDTPPEEEFDEITELASKICRVPISLISLIDSKRQWFKSKKGFSGESTPREVSFCGHAINQKGLFEIQNVIEDKRFFDNPFVTNDPHIRFYAGYPLSDSNNQVLGTLCVIDREPRTLTEDQRFALKVLANQAVRLIEYRKKTLDSRNQARKLSRKSDSLIQQKVLLQRYISMASHDIRSPISSLEGILALLEDGDMTWAEASPILLKLRKSIIGINKLLDSVSDFSKKFINSSEEKPEQFFVREMVENCAFPFRTDMDEKGIKIYNSIDPDLEITSDHETLTFILRNFIQNALKYTENGEIRIEVTQKKDSIIFSVTDTGKGISEEMLKNLNQTVRVSSLPGTRGEKGTGLGLTFCKELASRIKGKISFSHGPNGNGFTANLLLPSKNK